MQCKVLSVWMVFKFGYLLVIRDVNLVPNNWIRNNVEKGRILYALLHIMCLILCYKAFCHSDLHTLSYKRNYSTKGNGISFWVPSRMLHSEHFSKLLDSESYYFEYLRKSLKLPRQYLKLPLSLPFSRVDAGQCWYSCDHHLRPVALVAYKMFFLKHLMWDCTPCIKCSRRTVHQKWFCLGFFPANWII